MTRTNKNPFRDIADLENEVQEFMTAHRLFVSSQAKRISDYFEMCCYNHVVKFYERKGYETQVKNLQGNGFRYKLSPSGYPSNFSYFSLNKIVKQGRKPRSRSFEIRHNLTVQSSVQTDIYVTPDIAIINADSVVEEQDHYIVERSRKRFCYVPNKDLQSFCEVKQFNAFPELLFSFNGLCYEITIGRAIVDSRFKHLAPALMISGKSSPHTERIKSSLEGRSECNIIFDIFESGTNTFSRKNLSRLAVVGSV